MTHCKSAVIALTLLSITTPSHKLLGMLPEQTPQQPPLAISAPFNTSGQLKRSANFCFNELAQNNPQDQDADQLVIIQQVLENDTYRPQTPERQQLILAAVHQGQWIIVRYLLERFGPEKVGHILHRTLKDLSLDIRKGSIPVKHYAILTESLKWAVIVGNIPYINDLFTYYNIVFSSYDIEQALIYISYCKNIKIIPFIAAYLRDRLKDALDREQLATIPESPERMTEG